jgi:hypothetical protein
MSDYIFFDASLRDRFLAFLAERGFAAQTRPDRIAGDLVILADDLPDDLADILDEEYDRLMDEQQEMVEAEDEQDRTLMGVNITLPDGKPCTVRLPPEFARRLCDAFTGEEIQTLVAAIADDVLTPASGPLCRER